MEVESNRPGAEGSVKRRFSLRNGAGAQGREAGVVLVVLVVLVVVWDGMGGVSTLESFILAARL